MKKRSRKNTKFMEYFDDYNVEVFVDEFDNFDKAVKRFMKKVKEDKIFEQCWETRVYEKPSDKKRRLKRITVYNFKKNRSTDNQ